jgi:DinB family protein
MIERMMSNTSEVIAEAEQVGRTARAAFGALSAEQINWKPSSNEWSIAQSLEHLILLNTSYFPQIEKILADERRPSLWERVPLLPTFFGRLVLAAVQPESKRKVKARPAFTPASRQIDVGIVTRFLTHQENLIRLMKATAHLPIEKIIITSAVSPVVTYSLFDAYRILIAHEFRHLRQAENAICAQEFPGR